MTGKDVASEFWDKGLLIKQEDVELGYIAALKATNRQILVDYIREVLTAVPENGVLLHVALQDDRVGCNGFMDYKTEDDIPYHSVPCPCGNPKHWLIKYDEES